MATADYIYRPIYGIERFIDTGQTDPATGFDIGGAEVTNDNLIITMWNMTNFPIPGAEDPATGEILIPQYAVDGAVAPTAYERSMKGRIGAKFYLAPGPSKAGPNIMATMEPPQELKQQVANAVVFNGGVTDDLANYEIRKPLQGDYAWSLSSHLHVGENTIIPALGALDTTWSSYLSLDPGVAARPLPYLRTNGADGQIPRFFDPFTEAGVQEMIAAVNKGEFFVAMFWGSSTAVLVSEGVLEVHWPHSVPRG